MSDLPAPVDPSLARAEAAAAVAKKILATHQLTDEQLLGEVNELLRDVPSMESLGGGEMEALRWRGRASAVLDMWKPGGSIGSDLAMSGLGSVTIFTHRADYQKAIAALFEAQHSLKIRGGATGSVAIARGDVFDYFTAVKSRIEQAQTDLLIVDPYLDADFVERYLPYVHANTRVRLLTSDKRMAKLLPAIDMFTTQHTLRISIRERNDLHGRFLFIDGRLGFQSDPSFKDGAKNADAVMLEIVDVLPEVRGKFEQLWSGGTIKRGEQP